MELYRKDILSDKDAFLFFNLLKILVNDFYKMKLNKFLYDF